MVVSAPIRTISVCSGLAGIELGLGLVLPERTRTVCYIEREAWAAAALVARMEDAALDQAPVWDDVHTFNGRRWRGTVDLITAGVPCQPFSQAGQARGVEDDRYLWPDLARIIKETDAPAVFMENVPQILNRGLAEILTNFASLGFDVVWDRVSAESVGGSHLRERMFLLAVRHTSNECSRALTEIRRWRPLADADSGRREVEQEQDSEEEERPSQRRRDTDRRRTSHKMADSAGSRQQGRARKERSGSGRIRSESSGRSDAPSAEVADTSSLRRDVQRFARAIRRASSQAEDRVRQRERSGDEAGNGSANVQFPRFPPPPYATAEWQYILGRSPSLEPSICRVADGIPDRVDRVRALGNAVVPAVAAQAWCLLAPRAAMILHHWDERDA